jgi:hypothetical protein
MTCSDSKNDDSSCLTDFHDSAGIAEKKQGLESDGLRLVSMNKAPYPVIDIFQSFCVCGSGKGFQTAIFKKGYSIAVR